MAQVSTITIDSSQVPSNLTDFPVYVDLSDMNEDFWSTVTTNTNTHALDLESSSSQYASVSDNAALSITGDMSGEAMVKLESDTGSQQTIMSKWTDTGNQRSYIFRISPSSIALVLADTGTDPTVSSSSVSYTFQLGVYYHVAFTYDASAGEVKLYVNGVQVGATQTGARTSIYDGTADFRIGCRFSSVAIEFFDGIIDEVRVWNDIRTADEIRGNMRRELVGNEANLQGYWKLNNNYTDSTSNGNDLTGTGSPVFTTSSAFSTAGGDIRCYKSDGTTELPREIVSCDTTGETGEMHIKYTGTLSSSSDTEIQIHADGTSRDYATNDTYGAEAVWSDYEAVYHLNETSGLAIDSTSNHNYLTDNNTVGSATGKIEKGRDFERTNSEYFSIADASQTGLDITGDLTITGWINIESAPASGETYNIISKYDSGANQRAYDFHYRNDGGTPKMEIFYSDNGSNGYSTAVNHTLSTSTFTHFALPFDVSLGTLEVYINGSSQGSGNGTDVASLHNSGAVFAVGSKSTGADYMDGILDEVRVRSGLLSADWIAAEYTNQNTPTTFYTITDVGLTIDVPLNSLTLDTFALTLTFINPLEVNVPVNTLTLNTFIPSIQVGIWNETSKTSAPTWTATNKSSAATWAETDKN